MDFIKEWITNIILFILIATVIDMLLPNTKLQKYTKMVTGLLLIAIILTPILQFISKDFEQAFADVPSFQAVNENNMENSIEMKKKEIQASHDAYILENMAVQLKMDAEEELMAQYGLQIAHIEIISDEKDENDIPVLQQLIVQLEQAQEESEAVEAVEPVDINTGKPLPSRSEDHNSDRIASLLSESWDVDGKIIEVLVEGGA
ncbi:MAG: stage III sporulation protein AF [Cytobacillus gottheilii]|uniref:Stage III sporulation protein AF n=2 Tax=Cytobacillus gottheilii TaxID=859144 RepID=A0ABX8FIF8_9BACI|nr:stage III sporulation protein AF [Cytobacillus gottheilii]QVY63804.1 stage III sporulation protein AF [Cytobacillus gottheilii]